MTIAAGFVARDGVLLCTDSLYSGGVNVYGRKIFTFKYDIGVVSFALAGHEPFAKKAISDADEAIKDNPGYCRTAVDIRRLVEQSVKHAQEQYVDTRPDAEKEASRFQLLVAIATKADGALLFSSSGTVLTEVENYECFGSGAYVGHHIIQTAYRPRMKLEQVATIAIQAKAAAKRYVEGVGGPTQFECIRHSAVTETLSRFFPYDLASVADSGITIYEEEAARLLLALSDSEIDDDDFERRADAFMRSVREIRDEWKRDTKRSDLFEALRSGK